MTNREIVFVLKMRNEAQAAIKAFAEDLRRLKLAVPSGGSGGGSRPGGGGGGGTPGTVPAGATREAASAMTDFWQVAQRVAALMAGGWIVKTADELQLLHGRLSLVTSGTAQANAVFGELFALSNETRASFQSTADAYTRIARSAQGLGYSQRNLLDVTKLVNQGFVVSGTSASEAAGAMIQFGQALQSGVLQGDELRSLRENAPIIVEQIAKGMGVAVGDIKLLGEQGKMTSKVILDALIKQKDELQRQFAAMPLTVGQSLTLVVNAFTKIISEVDAVMNGSGGLAGVIKQFADFLQSPEVLGSVRALASGLSTVLHGAFVLINGTLQLMREHWGMVQAAAVIAVDVMVTLMAASMLPAILNAVRAVRTLMATIALATAMTGGLGALSAAFATLFTTIQIGMAKSGIGLVAVAIGAIAAAGLTWYYSSQKSKEGAETAGEAFRRMEREAASLNEKLKDNGDLVGKVAENWKELAEKLNPAIKRTREYNEATNLFQQKFDSLATKLKNGTLTQSEYNDEVRKTMGLYQTMQSTMAPGTLFKEQNEDLLRQIAGMKVARGQRQAYVQSLKTEAEYRQKIGAQNRDLSDAERAEVQATIDLQKKLSGMQAGEGLSDSIRDRILSLKTEQRLLGLTGVDLEVTRAREELLNQAKKQGLSVNAERLRQMEDEVRTTYEMKRAQGEKDFRFDKAQGFTLAAGGYGLVGAAVAKYNAEVEIANRLRQEDKRLTAEEALAKARSAEWQSTVNRAMDDYVAKVQGEYKTSLTDSIAGMRDEAAQIGLVGAALDMLRARQALAAQERKTGVPISDELRRKYLDEADSLAKLKAVQGGKDFTRDFVLGQQEAAAQLTMTGREAEDFAFEMQILRAAMNGVQFSPEQLDTIRRARGEFKQWRDTVERDIQGGVTQAARQYLEETANVGTQVGTLFKDSVKSMGDSLAEFVMTGKLNFKSFADGIIREMLRIAIQAMVLRPLLSMFGFSFGGGAGVSAGTASVAAMAHRGEIVGTATQASKAVSAWAFAGAPKFHRGGVINGLSSNEVPIIARRGEAVLPLSRDADGLLGVKMNGGGGATVAPTININFSGGAPQDANQAKVVGKEMGKAVDAAISDWAQRNMRPGGMLAGGLSG